MSSSNSNRLAKNTLILYARMLFTMAVKLYTSRIVLQALGVDDYGIYNVVGGIVVLFDFINNAMTSSTQRYITFEIGRGDKVRLNNVFITSLNIHLIISLIVIILTETIGLYLLCTKMVIPEDRFWAAFWVYQISIISSVINIMSLPYNATIIAHERMSVFAYISLFEVIAKLTIAYVIMFASNDKLVLYAALMAILQLLVRFINSIYCSKKLEGTSYRLFWDKALFKEMSSFAGWNLVGNLSGIMATQGQNILLNIFFGPVVNAARAIAIQVQAAVFQFSSGFQTAINPQITKSYANSDLHLMHQLIYKSSKLSYLVLFILCSPFFFEAPFILKLWLGDVPTYTIIFLRIILIISLIDCSANSLMTSAAATGKVKRYQLTAGLIVLSICPITYIVFKGGGEPYMAFIVHLIICCIVYYARLHLLKSMISLNIKEFFNEVIIKCVTVSIVTFGMMIPILFIPDFNGELQPIVNIILSVIIASIIGYYIGLNNREKKFVISKIHTLLNRTNKQSI